MISINSFLPSHLLYSSPPSFFSSLCPSNYSTAQFSYLSSPTTPIHVHVLSHFLPPAWIPLSMSLHSWKIPARSSKPWYGILVLAKPSMNLLDRIYTSVLLSFQSIKQLHLYLNKVLHSTMPVSLYKLSKVSFALFCIHPLPPRLSITFKNSADSKTWIRLPSYFTYPHSESGLFF